MKTSLCCKRSFNDYFSGVPLSRFGNSIYGSTNSNTGSNYVSHRNNLSSDINLNNDPQLLFSQHARKTCSLVDSMRHIRTFTPFVYFSTSDVETVCKVINYYI